MKEYIRTADGSIVTSSGVVKNPEKPRVGVVSLHSLESWFCEEIDSGTDITFEQHKEETEQEVRRELEDKLVSENSDNESLNEGRSISLEIDESEVERLVDEKMQDYECDSRTVLIGAWEKNDRGEYELVKDGSKGDWAATYNSDSGNICVNWSKFTSRCRNTSPCYVMADGSGPLADLDNKDEDGPCVGYDFPGFFYRKDNT